MPTTPKTAATLTQAADDLRKAVGRLSFSPPVTHVYNPLDYAWEPHRTYLNNYATTPKRVVFLGMNPGPWGMAQVGVPFGEVAAVRDWLGIHTPVQKPHPEHPKRPVEGFACTRSEVSGRRLWGLFQSRFKTPQHFFADHLVLNYCPLVFMEQSGRNRTPDKLPATEKSPLHKACDQHLNTVLEALAPEFAVGIGRYATDCLQKSNPTGATVTTILHPSPASPAANRGWAPAATRQLVAAGVWNA